MAQTRRSLTAYIAAIAGSLAAKEGDGSHVCGQTRRSLTARDAGEAWVIS